MAETIIEIADAAVAKIAAHWQPTGDNQVRRTYTPGLNLKSLPAGRDVQVWFEEWGQSDIATRAEDRNSYVVWFAVYELYTIDGDVPNEWVDERVEFTKELWSLLAKVRTETEPLFPTPLDDVIATDSNKTPPIVDDRLLDDKKLFAMGFAVEYQRDEPGET